MRFVRPSAFFVILFGGLAGTTLSAALIGAGARCLDTPSRASVHYSAAVALALLLQRLSSRRPGSGAVPTIVLATLLTFALRRWLDVWVNLEPLEWGSGPAGEATAVVFPFEGLVFAIVAVGDARSRDVA
jgi:hypothetical protein